MLQSTHDIITTHPHPTNMFHAEDLAACVDACMVCSSTCTSCADACLAEDNVQQFIRCIRLNLDCADICNATRTVMLRRTIRDETVLRAQLEACIAACQVCGKECEMHARMNMSHCDVCAQACRHCEQACRQLLNSFRA